jgi:activator of HSP90 ATPase
MKRKIFSAIIKKHFICQFFLEVVVFITVILFMQFSAFAQNGNIMSEEKTLDSSITIHQETDFKASPQQLYTVLLSSKEFSNCIKKSFPVFSAMSANIDSIVGGSFSLFDGHIIGRILELVPNQRIVEAWRVVDWPAGVYSIAKFEFHLNGSGTTLVFDHIGFPTGLKDHLSSGWKEHYWNALADYFK